MGTRFDVDERCLIVEQRLKSAVVARDKVDNAADLTDRGHRGTHRNQNSDIDDEGWSRQIDPDQTAGRRSP